MIVCVVHRACHKGTYEIFFSNGSGGEQLQGKPGPGAENKNAGNMLADNVTIAKTFVLDALPQP